MKVLKNCRFIPELMEGYEGTSGDVLVKDDRILKITECADAVSYTHLYKSLRTGSLS